MTVRDRERAQAMALRYARGDTLKDIAAEHGVSKEAVRQILLRSGYVTRGAAQRARQAQERRRQSDRRAAVVARLEQSPRTMTRSEAAAQLGMSSGQLATLIGPAEANRLLVWSPGDRPQRYSDPEILEALRAVARELGTARLTYAAYKASRGEELPSGVRIAQRFGSWAVACGAAGLEPGGRPRTYRNRRSDQELLGYLRLYLADATTFAFSEYQQMARDRGWPSGTLMRNRFGSWNQAKAAAQSANSPQDAQSHPTMTNASQP